MTAELRVSAEEGGGDPELVTGWRFRQEADGSVEVLEEWPYHDEIYSDGHAITLPPKAAALFATWLAALTTSPSTPPAP